jgi:transposase
MRNIKDVLRLKYVGKLSHERIAMALGVSKGVVTKYAGLANAAGLTGPSCPTHGRDSTAQPADQLCSPAKCHSLAQLRCAFTRNCAAKA